MSSLFLKNHSALASTFVIELLTHPGAFPDFYDFVGKKHCGETLEFCLVALFYKSCPSVQRRILEPQIFDCFVKSASPKEINVPAKLKKELSEAIGLGKSEVFDPALIHCTESLCTNFWIGFAANVRDGKASKFSKSSIKSAAPKYLHTAALSVFCLKAAKMPYFNFQGFDRLRSWLETSTGENFAEVVCNLLSLDNDSVFLDSVTRLVADSAPRMGKLFSSMLAPPYSEKSATWTLKGFPEDIAMCFLSHCADREVNKSLKKTVEQLYATCSVREATLKVDVIKKFLALLLDELVRPKDIAFKKAKLLLYYIHTACKQAYPNAADTDVLRYGAINVLFRYLIKTLEDPYCVGLYPSKGIFARPTIVAIGTILTYYSTDMHVEEVLANKDKAFQQCYHDGLAHCKPILDRITSYYAEWLLNSTEGSVWEDYQIVVAEETKYYGTEDELFSFNVEHQYAMVGQHLVNYKDHYRVRHAKLDDGQMKLREFVGMNSFDSLKDSVKPLKFPTKPVK